MKDGSTQIMVILDRTGSMESIKEDVMGGFNAFLDGQPNGEGTASITLVQFDSQDPFEVVYADRDIREARDPRDVRPSHQYTAARCPGPRHDLPGPEARQAHSGQPAGERALFRHGRARERQQGVHPRPRFQNDCRAARPRLGARVPQADEAAIHEAHTLGFAADASMRFARGEAAVTGVFYRLSEATLRRRSRERQSRFFRPEERLAQEETNKEEEPKP